MQYLLDQTNRIARIGGWEYDLIRKELLWTPQTYRIHGLPLDYKPNPEEAIKFYHPAHQPILKKAAEKLLSEGKSYDLELQFITKKGTNLWIRTTGRARKRNGKIVSIYGTFQDISEQKKKEIELMQSRIMAENAIAKFRSILDNARDAIFLIAPDYTILELNQAAIRYSERMTGITPRKGAYALDLLQPQQVEPFRISFNRCLQGETLNLDWKITFRNRQKGWFEITYAPVKNEHNKVVAVNFSAIEISHRIKELESYRLSEESFKSMAELNPIPMLVHQDLKLVYANQATIRAFDGKNLNDLLGKNVMDFIHPDSLEIVKKRIQRIYTDQADAGLQEEKLITLEGRVLHVQVFGTRIYFMGRMSALVMFFNPRVKCLVI